MDQLRALACFVTSFGKGSPKECLITDESSLWDFHGGDDNREYLRKIALLYGVDVSDVKPPTLAAISEKIRRER